MRTLKSFWFWLLVVWIVAGGLAAWILVLKLPAWNWICTAGIAAWLVLGIGLALYLRQKALIKVLSKGAMAQSSDDFEESWKTGFASDVRKLLEALGTELPGRSGSALRERRLVWTVSADFEASRRFLTSSGAVDATESRRHELSGEFQALANWLTRKDEIFVLLRELPDPRVPATLSRAGFLLELLSQRGKARPVDAALVLSPLQKEILPPAIHAAVGYLAEASGVEFPIHLGLHGAETLPGGDEFFRVCPDPPGTTLPWTRQEDLPLAFDQAWARLEADIDAKESGHLASAWDKSFPPEAVFQFLDSIRKVKEGAKSATLSCASQFVCKPHPFLRGIYLLPSQLVQQKARAAALSASTPDAMFFGSAAFQDVASPPAGSVPVAAETSVAALEAFLEHLHSEPALARLGAGRQVKASVVSLAVFVISILLSVLLVWSALHGWVTGASLEKGWQVRLAQDKSVTWADASSMRAGLPAFDDIDRLVTDIDDGRPWLLAPGFYRRGNNLPAAERQFDTMTHQLVRGAFSDQETRLRALTRSRDTAQDNENLYDALKAYLLSTRQGWVEGEPKVGKKGLADAFVRAWSEYLGYSGALPPFERSVLPRVAEHIAQRVADGDSSWLGAQDANLVATARMQLRNAKNQTGTFAHLLAAADTLPKLDWDSLGLPQTDLTCRPLEIPAAFTRRGWLEAVRPTLKSMSEGGSDWVMGAQEQETSAASGDVIAELKRRYVEGFATAWRAVLDTSTCALPADNQRIGSTLATLASPYNPQNPRGLQAFFQRILAETDLTPPKDTSKSLLPANVQKAAANAEKTVAEADKLLGGDDPVDVQVARQLGSLRGLSSDVGKGALDAYIKDLAQLGILFGQWTGADGAFQFAKGIAAQDARNPLVHAWNEAAARRDALPADLRPWFQSFTWGLLRQVAGRAFPQAQAQAQAGYKEKVLLPWQNLSKGGYPLDPYAENEAAIGDLDALLNPKTGTLASYLADLAGLVQVQNGDVRAVAFNGMGMSLDPGAVEPLRKLLRLSDFFYGKGGNAWKGLNTSISVHADPRAHVTLRVGSQTLDVPPGTDRKLSLRWPMPDQNGISLQVATVNQTFEEKRDGQWALLRLMDSKSPGSPDATFSFDERSYIVDVPLSVHIDQPGGPFQDRDFFHVALLPDLFR
jgi:type VI protein secretion system component VasK